MAVTQISTIQVRYGLQADIGNLAAGEFAWAIDTQRLFIGNGDISEGAPYPGMTEIATNSIDLTQFLGNYTFKGELGGYTVQTGDTANNNTVRLLQDKIDDFVNVRDFGASGTGNANDATALQRAIDEIYNRRLNSIPIRTRRVIRFNAGTYRIDSDLRIPPHTVLVGEGKDSVKLLLTNGAKIKLATSTGGDTALHNSSVEYPHGIHIQGLTIATTNDADAFAINGVDGLTFEDVAFEGPRTNPSNLGNTGSGLVINSSINVAKNITFSRCDFSKMTYAVYLESVTGTSDINFVNCTFDQLYSAVYTVGGDAESVKNIKISSSLFTNIYGTAIYGDVGVTGIISLGNTFKNVASNLEGDTAPSTSWSPVIVFQADNNYSIADIFGRTLENSTQFPRIQADGFDVAALSVDEAFRLGYSYVTPGRRVEIASGEIGYTTLPNFTHGFINYTATKANDVRTGTIKCTALAQLTDDVVYDDEYAETADIGLSLTLEKVNGKTRLQWAADADGIDLTLTFDTKTLH